MIDLEEKTLNELKDLAKENNIKNISKLKKEELVEVLASVLTINTTNNKDNIIIEYKLISQEYPLKIEIMIGEINNEI